MENENNALFEEQNDHNNENNRDNLFKFLVSVIINIVIVTCFLSYLLKDDKISNHLTNKKYKTLKVNKNKNVNLRILDDEDLFSRLEKQILSNSKNSVIEEEMKKYLNLLLENLGNGFNSIHDIIIGRPYLMTKEQFILEKQKEIFLSRLLKNIYTGYWEYFPYEEEIQNISSLTKLYYLNSSDDNFNIGGYKNGSVYFNFKNAVEMSNKKEALALNMKNLGGDYIDNWIQHISYAKLEGLKRTVDHENKTFSVKGEFSTTMIKGKYFPNRKYSQKKIQCNTLTEMTFPLSLVTLQTQLNNRTVIIKNISTIDPRNFSMILSSTCGFRIKINAEILDRAQEYFDNKIKVNYFSYYSTISSILYLIGASGLTIALNKNENSISCISLECFCQNIAWHTYCGMTNINLGLYYSEYFGVFCILALFPLLNFMVADLRFLYFYWKIKKRVTNDRNFIKLRLKFFGLFYSLLLFSFFSISYFYINEIYITILSIALWTPQIIHNIIINNKYIYPTFYIIVTTIDRMIYPFYCRGYKYNYIQLKENLVLIIILSSYILLTIIILYLQTFLGPRFMLPAKYQKKKVDFYKTKEELLKIKPDCTKEECVICLTPLLEEEDDTININNKDKDQDKDKDKNMNVDVTIKNDNKNENEIDNVNDGSPAETPKTNESTNCTSRIDILNDKSNDDFITNHLDTKKNLKEGLHLCNTNNNNNINNNTALAIPVNKQIIINQNHKKKFFLIKNFGKVIKIILCESMFKFYKVKQNFGDKKYMLITCGHVFHISCVEQWFERKKECPNCRANMEEYL